MRPGRTRLALAPLAAALAIAAAAPAAAGPKGQRAQEICAEALDERYRAVISGGVNVKESNNRHWVRGNAISEEAGMSFRFRCMAYYGSVRSLEVLEQRAGLGASGGRWAPAPPPVEFDDEEPVEDEAEAQTEDAPEEEEQTEEERWIATRPNIPLRPEDAEGYAPDEGIRCYDEVRACYDDATGAYDAFWSAEEFAAE